MAVKAAWPSQRLHVTARVSRCTRRHRVLHYVTPDIVLQLHGLCDDPDRRVIAGTHRCSTALSSDVVNVSFQAATMIS